MKRHAINIGAALFLGAAWLLLNAALDDTLTTQQQAKAEVQQQAKAAQGARP